MGDRYRSEVGGVGAAGRVEGWPVEWVGRKASVGEPCRFTACGLSNVYLAGIAYEDYGEGRWRAAIPEKEALLELVARELVMQRWPLLGEEIRYLRGRLGREPEAAAKGRRAAVKAKGERGLKQVEFGGEIGVRGSTLSRVESGAQRAGEPVDKLIRLHYLLFAGEGLLFGGLGGGGAEVARLRGEVRGMLAGWSDGWGGAGWVRPRIVGRYFRGKWGVYRGGPAGEKAPVAVVAEVVRDTRWDAQIKRSEIQFLKGLWREGYGLVRKGETMPSDDELKAIYEPLGFKCL